MNAEHEVSPEVVEPTAPEEATDTPDQDTEPAESTEVDFAALDLADLPAVIRAASFLLRRDGWTREMYRNHLTGARCLYGALRDVYELADAPKPDRYSAAYAQHGSSYYAIAQYLERRATEWYDASAVEFNDHKASGIDDVTGFLDRAADEFDPALTPYKLRPGTSYWEISPEDAAEVVATAA